MTYAIVSQPKSGTITDLNEDTGSLVYTSDAGFTGKDSFTFKANDGTVDSNTATVTITVNAIGPPPEPEAEAEAEDSTLEPEDSPPPPQVKIAHPQPQVKIAHPQPQVKIAHLQLPSQAILTAQISAVAVASFLMGSLDLQII